MRQRITSKHSAMLNRRAFLQRATAGVSAVSLASSPHRGIAQALRSAPSDRVVVGLIGAGDFGHRQHLGRLLLAHPKLKNRVQVAAICDVDEIHREQAASDVWKQTNQKVSVYKDFRDLLERRDIDAVLIIVPDHWHAIIAVAAMESGKDVYCEKPLTLTINEGKAMVAAARRYGTVVQTGSQQRSDPHYFGHACELVRAGKIGELEKVTTHFSGVDTGSWQVPRTPPAHLDWNFWLGPAPHIDYTPNRCHFHFRWFSDYSGGKITDHGAHHNDIAQWIIGADGSGPTQIEGTGTFHNDGPHDVTATHNVTFTYGKHGNVKLVCTSEPSPHGGQVDIYGSDGWISVSRSRILASNPDIIDTEPGPRDIRFLESYALHYENWLNCIHSRQKPVCDVEIGHRSVTVCHLANIAILTGRPLRWDPALEYFVDDPAADRLLSRPMRAPWRL